MLTLPDSCLDCHYSAGDCRKLLVSKATAVSDDYVDYCLDSKLAAGCFELVLACGTFLSRVRLAAK
jgi:hypothetical protein